MLISSLPFTYGAFTFTIGLRKEEPMRRSQDIIILIIAFVMASCGLMAPKAPMGTYDCYGHERGLLAHTGRLIIQPEGTVEFLRQTGTWTYDRDAATFTFTGEIPLAQAHYDGELSKLHVDLRPDADVTHAELGTMSCEFLR
jgi:hypothetical protein